MGQHASYSQQSPTHARNLTRKRSLIETIEGYRRQEPDHSNRKLIEIWKPVGRIQLKTLLDVAKEMSSMENLQTMRELERKFQNLPPWQHLHQPKIVTSLLDKKITKEAEPNILKLCAQETINSYNTSAIHAYTDGSAFKATINAGFGILIKYPDESSSEYSDSCGTNCSNYEAEKIAIKTAMQLIHQRFELSESNPKDVIIFSNAKSALEALQNPPYQDQITPEIALGISNLIAAHAVHRFQWIPGHCNISGNETADKLAKLGATKPQKIPPCTQNTIKQILKKQ